MTYSAGIWGSNYRYFVRGEERRFFSIKISIPFLKMIELPSHRRGGSSHNILWPFFWTFVCSLISVSPISTALVINAIPLSYLLLNEYVRILPSP